MHWTWNWTRGPEPQPAAIEAPKGPSELAKKDVELRATFFSKYLDESYKTTSASVDRYRAAATVIQTVATALGALYTGALALVFGAEQGGLPARGLLTPAFFALALVLSLVYSSYLKPEWVHAELPPLWHGAAEANGYAQLHAFQRDVSELVTRNIGSLHAAVLALGAAILVAPAPFIRDPDVQPTLTEWPETPQGSGAAILAQYEAELTETAAVRAAERGSPGDFFSRDLDLPWLLCGGVVFVALLLWSMTATRRARARLGSGKAKG